MIEQEIEIRTPDGTADGFLYRADDGQPLPGVIFLTDIGGIRPSQRTMARRLSEAGYTVLLPNIFYRTGRPPMFGSPFKAGEERSMKRMGELTSPLTPEAVEKLEHALKAWGGKFESEVYEGAYHGWTVLDNPAYNQPQAERAFAKLTELYAKTLGNR